MIPITVVEFGEDAERLVLEVLRSGNIAQGPLVKQFEDRFAQMIGVKHAIALNNGTTSLVAALQVLDLDPATRSSRARSPSSRPSTRSSRPARRRGSPTSRRTTSTSPLRASPERSPTARARSCRCTSTGRSPTWTPSPRSRGARPRPRRGLRPVARFHAERAPRAVPMGSARSRSTRRRTSRPARAGSSRPTTTCSPIGSASCGTRACARGTSTRSPATTGG